VFAYVSDVSELSEYSDRDKHALEQFARTWDVFVEIRHVEIGEPEQRVNPARANSAANLTKQERAPLSLPSKIQVWKAATEFHAAPWRFSQGGAL
jgi:hypothetical protein